MQTVKWILVLVVLSVVPSLSTLGQDNGLPFKHTACASGVDLTGQTIVFPQVIDQTDQIDSLVDPLKAGYADASAYFNGHGGICGATIQSVFSPSEQSSNTLAQYQSFAALTPRPVLMALYTSSASEDFHDILAQDKIPALLVRGGSVAGLYGTDGQTPSWIYAANPLYVNQLGAMCNYLGANPNTYPKPMMGIISEDDGWARSAVNDATIGYCQAHGVGFVGARYAGDASLKPLLDLGANVIYTMTLEDTPARIATAAYKLGLQDRFTLAGVNLVMDPAIASFLADAVPQGTVPPLNGTIGILSMRTWSEKDDPGIQLITQQADANARPAKLRTQAYIRAWSTIDLFIEAYIQTVNRVGTKAVTGEEMKATLDQIDYSTLGGVQKFAYDGGARRDVRDYRIGKIAYLGADGRSPASATNPPLMEGNPPAVVPLLLPLTDFLPVPDLRPGGADVPVVKAASPTATATGPTATARLGAGQFVIAANNGKGGGDSNVEIYAMNTDGSNLTQLTDNQNFDGEPIWSPDGSKIVFTSDRDGNSEIYVMNADGSNPINLSKNPALDAIPTWSPDGTKIAFDRVIEGKEEIYVMNADGSNQTNLTNNPTFDAFANYSPDGKKIAFTSDRGGRDEIYIMNADGSDVTKLTDTTVGDNLFPLWSPDGSKIIFNSDRDGDMDIYSMNPDGSDLVNLTNDDVGEEKAAWSPDGKQIIFPASLTEHWDMFVMNADGSNITNVTNGGKVGWASWKAG
jgi:hypothetical protein